MRTFAQFLAVFAATQALGACALPRRGPTPYGPAPAHGGLVVESLRPDEWLITSNVNALTDPTLAYRYWQRQALELARAAGCDDYEVLELAERPAAWGWHQAYGRARGTNCVR